MKTSPDGHVVAWRLRDHVTATRERHVASQIAPCRHMIPYDDVMTSYNNVTGWSRDRVTVVWRSRMVTWSRDGRVTVAWRSRGNVLWCDMSLWRRSDTTWRRIGIRVVRGQMGPDWCFMLFGQKVVQSLFILAAISSQILTDMYTESWHSYFETDPLLIKHRNLALKWRILKQFSPTWQPMRARSPGSKSFIL